jgi:hypothetical protein
LDAPCIYLFAAWGRSFKLYPSDGSAPAFVAGA